MFENITNIAYGRKFNLYTDVYSGSTSVWKKPTEEDIRKEICKYYLINYAGWSESEAEVGGRNFAVNTGWTLTYMVDQMNQVKDFKNSWDSGTTNVYAKWRDNNYKLLFFPKLDMSNVTNAERCWHSNYNCQFYPSVDLPLATNVAGMFYYDDCQYICGNINLPSLTEIGSNRFIFANTRLRNKITINIPNVTSMRNGLLQQTYLDYVPTVNAPKLPLGYMTFAWSRFNKYNDVFRELGNNIAWSANTDFRWFAYGTSGTSKFDLSLIDMSSAIQVNSMFYECSTGFTIDFPKTLNLPNATQMKYMFGYAPIKIVYDINCPNAESMDVAFASNTLEKIGIVNCSKVQTIQAMFYDCSALTEIGGLTNLGSGFTTASTVEERTLDLSYSPLLSKESILNIFNSIATLNDVDGYINLSTDMLGQLTNEEKKIATDKGWVLK